MKSSGCFLSFLALIASVSCGEVSVTINGTPNAMQWSSRTNSRVTINYKSESIFGKLKLASNDMKVYAVCYGSHNIAPSQVQLQNAVYMARYSAFHYIGDVPCDDHHMGALQLCVVKPPALGGLFSRSNAQVEIVPRRCSVPIQIKSRGVRPTQKSSAQQYEPANEESSYDDVPSPSTPGSNAWHDTDYASDEVDEEDSPDGTPKQSDTDSSKSNPAKYQVFLRKATLSDQVQIARRGPCPQVAPQLLSAIRSNHGNIASILQQSLKDGRVDQTFAGTVKELVRTSFDQMTFRNCEVIAPIKRGLLSGFGKNRSGQTPFVLILSDNERFSFSFLVKLHENARYISLAPFGSSKI